MRVGLNSGEVVLRASISGLPSDYSAIGETAHVASRVEQLAQPGTIALTAQTLKLLAGLVDVAPLGPFEVKGLAQPIELYRLLGIRAERSRIRGPQDRPLSRFIGRNLEMGVLAETLRKARAGNGQLVAVVGEPSVGKSRLFLEFMRSPEVAGCLVLESGSESFGPTNPMVPVIELARGYLNVERGDDLAAVNARLEHRLGGIEGEDRDEIFNAFQALLVPDEELPLRRIGNPAGAAVPHPERRRQGAAARKPPPAAVDDHRGSALDRRRQPFVHQRDPRPVARRLDRRAGVIPAGLSAGLGPSQLFADPPGALFAGRSRHLPRRAAGTGSRVWPS